MNPFHDGAKDGLFGTVKIIGIGQSLRGDDAAGLAAVRLWQQIYLVNKNRPNLQVDLVELPGIGLLDLIEGATTVILVDTVRSNAKAGTVHLLVDEQLDAFSSGSGSAHGWGVAETLSLGKLLNPSNMPESLLLIGIEAGDISLGESLSPEVEMVLPKVACLIERLAFEGKFFDQELSQSSRISPR